ncbi:MAG TPA: 4-alpha-glucanotransferase [Dehalococcoidia bacterium]|nr:4-alpha-glucanotransferase [Dehalococcoidia bacterium]
MAAVSGINFLHKLAHLYGVQTAYYDVSRRQRQASAETLLAILKALDTPVKTMQDIPSAWRQRQQALWQQLLEPVAVAWDGMSASIKVRLPVTIADKSIECHLRMESDEWQHWRLNGSDLPSIEAAEIEGRQYIIKALSLPEGLPWGYHRFTMELGGSAKEALIISAPTKAYAPAGESKTRLWGAFVPLYALHSENSWGGGDFSDMETLMSWISGMGGGVVATLPLLPTYYDSNSNVSPYLPISRRLWNEFYLNIEKAPELQNCPLAQTILESSPFQKEIEALHDSPLVDYRRQMTLKRRILEELCQHLFARPSPQLEALRNYVEANPLVEDYSRFRATGEEQNTPWRFWPQQLRDGVLPDTDYNEANRRYHLYVQWLAHQQIESLSHEARNREVQLYLDLPLGVHPDGYDVWRERDAFLLDVSAGAPPDAVFTKGQNWTFPPLHPDRAREQGYRYVIDYLRHHLKHAGILRIDHAMGLHRLFCIPRGMEASQGTYLRYRADELYAILALESHRHKTIIVGEDLGTVPHYVRPAMNKHGLSRMYVLNYELISDTQKELPPVPGNSVASLNTHDMPPFAAFWREDDIQQRLDLGLLDNTGARGEKRTRRVIREVLIKSLEDKGWLKKNKIDAAVALKGCLSFLAVSKAPVVLVNLEDLWLETQPQNVPSTVNNYPNWQHKARYRLEEFCQMPQVTDTLRHINKLREQGRNKT